MSHASGLVVDQLCQSAQRRVRIGQSFGRRSPLWRTKYGESVRTKSTSWAVTGYLRPESLCRDLQPSATCGDKFAPPRPLDPRCGSHTVLDDPDDDGAYFPISERHLSRVVLLVRTKTDSETFFRPAREVAALAGLTPTVRKLSPASVQGEGGVVLMGILGLVATLLAFTGVFGLVALAVA